jgi:hypothetical protein
MASAISAPNRADVSSSRHLGKGLQARHHRRDALLPLFERRPAGCVRVVHGLDHRAGALRDRLALRPRGDTLEKIPHVARKRRVDGALERGDSRILVLRLQRNRRQLRGVGHAADRLERRLRVCCFPCDARE